MSTPVQLSLPLSATALRLGAAFLNQLADQTETIYGELTGLSPFASRNVEVTVENVGIVEHPIDPATRVETDAERIKRLHGNVASAGGDTDGPLNAAKVFGGEAPKPTATDAVAPVAPQAPSPDAPVAPTAPTPTAPAAPAQNSGVVTDKAGIPYDKRIHSSPASINKGDGLWRAKRGRDEIEAKRIEAELLELMKVPAPVAPTASAPASTTPKNLGELMTWAQAQVAAGNIASLDAVRAAAVEAGVAALPLLGTRPDLVPVVYAALGGV